jgi:hypothetical protein
MISVKCCTTCGTLVRHSPPSSRSSLSRPLSAMNEQKQTRSIDWKIRVLMILIASVHDFNFRNGQAAGKGANPIEDGQTMRESFRIKTARLSGALRTARQTFARLCRRNQYLLAPPPSRKENSPDQQKIALGSV